MYQLRHYLDMMTDEHRMAPHDAAIRSAVRPGDVVLDLGAGAGAFTFIALDAGAAHVYAIEHSPAIELAQKVARANGLADRVTFIQADARTIVPPRQVDGLISDLRGATPLLGDSIDLFEIVRDRWLKPDGYTIPLADDIHVAPVASPEAHQIVEGWRHLGRAAQYDVASEHAANRLFSAYLNRDDVIAPSQVLGTIRYDGTPPRKFTLRSSFVAAGAAAMTGLGLWFTARLTPDIVFDTSPHSPSTVYAQGFLPLSHLRPVAAGETLDVTVAVHRTLPESIWSWTVASRTGAWTETHSTFKGALLGLGGTDLLGDARRPSLSDEGQMAREVLDAMDGNKNARELAAGLMTAFPGRFASLDEALPAVAKVLGRYGGP